MKTITSTQIPVSTWLETEEAVAFVKSTFETELCRALNLSRVSAPMIVLGGTGINDDLNGTERAVKFPIKDMEERKAEVVHSLAKWKRLRLKEYGIAEGKGILADMRALRPDEELTPIHSIFVDQWDWEKHINREQRNLGFLKEQVRKIYAAILRTEKMVFNAFPEMLPSLPQEITFIHSEDLFELYPNLSAKEREHRITKDFGAVFIIGIGGALANGKKHDGRAPDYDDWSTPTSADHKGLNGDILVWNPILQQSFELSSMGIRVDEKALLEQLETSGAEDRKQLFFHQQILGSKLPLSMGGGIGQSRMCMFLLRKHHIGEVQASIWPAHIRSEYKARGINLL